MEGFLVKDVSGEEYNDTSSSLLSGELRQPSSTIVAGNDEEGLVNDNFFRSYLNFFNLFQPYSICLSIFIPSFCIFCCFDKTAGLEKVRLIRATCWQLCLQTSIEQLESIWSIPKPTICATNLK